MTAEAKTLRLKDGRELVFLFDISGICAAEDAGGTGLELLILGSFRQRRRGYLTALVYGGLKSHQPEITLPEAYDLVNGAESVEVGRVLGEALDSALPEAERVANPPKRGPAAGTGSRSSTPGSRKGSAKKASGGKPRAGSRSS